MKGLILFLLGVVVGGYAVHLSDRGEGPHWPDSFRGNGSGHESISDKLRRWHLTGDDIKDDLAKTGQVVREKAKVAGAKIADARVTAMIKAKYILDRDLSARQIQVDVQDGHVTLTGTVPSIDLVGKATALALDTDGVENVTARLTVAE
jgi:BON domain